MASFSSWLDSIPIPVMEGNSPVLQFIGRWSYEVYQEREMFLMYIHLLFSALFPIYIGSHASLRCPPSAEDPAKKKVIGSPVHDEDDDDLDELEEQSALEGMTPSDAILFPVFASITLGGLYFLIKWLNDPALLNRILGYYFSLIGIFGVGKLAGDALNVLTSVVFPSVWSRGNEVYYIDPLLSQQFLNAPTTRGMNRAPLHRKFTGKTSPLPGAISMLKLPETTNKLLWNFRALVTNHWIFRCYVHGIANIKAKVRLNDVMGLILGISAIMMYNTNGKAWWLTNLMGFGFCYGTLQMMSPTTFWTGSLVLGGLFVYDIVMVFYTPLMITVATSLDIPIKLVFPHSKRGGMLGLGDVVLPGIMMALALRFDLYLYYLRKPSPSAISHSLTPDSEPKPTYETATGRWGDRFWTRALSKSALPSDVAAAAFPKVYFYASVVGYVLGMIITLVVLNVFNHAQPALLYLVPGVLIALWGTALFRGELKLMWNYTEAGSSDNQKEETKDGKDSKEKDTEKKTEDKKEQKEEKEEKEKEEKEEEKEEEEEEEEEKEEDKNKSQVTNEHAHHVFLLSLSSPRRGPKPGKFLKTA